MTGDDQPPHKRRKLGEEQSADDEDMATATEGSRPDGDASAASGDGTAAARAPDTAAAAAAPPAPAAGAPLPATAAPGGADGAAGGGAEGGPPAPPAAAGGAAAQGGPAPGAYTQRELYLMKLEGEGQLEFTYVVNDGTPQNMMWLIGLKNIFSRQLPNMPREYIVRLVLDRRHRSVAVVRSQTKQVVGGITYRSFPEQGFGEIAFCAVTSSEQVKGFGTRLMNYTKEYAKRHDGLCAFLTYADNNAVGYFLKQGFTKAITMPKEQWVGYIKDYDGGTLMEALLHPVLDYTDLPGAIRAQRADLDAEIRKLSNSHVVHPGLAHFQQQQQQGGGKAEPLDALDIPGVREAGYEGPPPPGYSLVVGGRPQPPTPEHLQAFMRQLLLTFGEQEEAWPFHAPVSPDEVADYYDVVKDPRDLTTMRAELEARRTYVTLELLVADLRRMLQNARLYNSADTIYYKLANRMDQYLDGYLEQHVLHDAAAAGGGGQYPKP